MKKYNIFKIVLIVLFVFVIFSWIFPAAYYSGTGYQDQGRLQMGLFDMFNYPITALSYFGYIAIFLILIGGFYGVLYRIPAYRSFLDKIVDSMKGMEKICISIMIIIIALLVSFCGLQIGIAIFVPFIVALILLMGYDKIVAAFVVVGSVGAGLIGTTLSTTNNTILLQALNIKFDFHLGARFIILIIAIALVIFNTLWYIKKNMKDVKIEKPASKKIEEKKAEEKVEKVEKVEKKTTSSKASNKKSTNSKSKNKKSSSKSKNKAALKDEDVIIVKENDVVNEGLVPSTVSGKHSTWPFVVSLILVFVLVVLAFLSWGENGFNVSAFDDATKSATGFKLFGFAIFGKLLGTINAFGSWSITDMLLPMTLIIVILMIIYKVRIDEAFDGFVSGAKKALGPAIIVVMLYTILVLVTYHPFQLVMYKTILGWSKGFNIACTSIVAILAGLFNVDATYAFSSVITYYASVVSGTANYNLAALIFQTMYGLTMLVAPTSLVLMASLSYLKVPYKKWLKVIWPLLLELFVVLLIIFLIISVI